MVKRERTQQLKQRNTFLPSWTQHLSSWVPLSDYDWWVLLHAGLNTPGTSPGVCSPCWGPTLWRSGSLWWAGNGHYGWTWRPTPRRWFRRRRSERWGPRAPRTLDGRSEEESIGGLVQWTRAWKATAAATHIWSVCHTAPLPSCHRGAGCLCCYYRQTGCSGGGGTRPLWSPRSGPPCWPAWCPRCLEKGNCSGKQQKAQNFTCWDSEKLPCADKSS